VLLFSPIIKIYKNSTPFTSTTTSSAANYNIKVWYFTDLGWGRETEEKWWVSSPVFDVLPVAISAANSAFGLAT